MLALRRQGLDLFDKRQHRLRERGGCLQMDEVSARLKLLHDNVGDGPRQDLGPGRTTDKISGSHQDQRRNRQGRQAVADIERLAVAPHVGERQARVEGGDLRRGLVGVGEIGRQ